MGNQHLAHGGFVAHQLYQLIDAVLLEQIFRALLLQRQPGIEKVSRERLPRPASASQLNQPCCCMVLSSVRIWRRELSRSASSLSVVSCDCPSQHCQRRINCCCRRPEGIKGELLTKNQQFIYPYIRPIILPDEARR
jgi:hypothetical protein